MSTRIVSPGAMYDGAGSVADTVALS